MTEEKYENYYNQIKKDWEVHLKKHGVILSGLRTKNSLALVYLFSKMGHSVSKKELTDFFNSKGYPTNDVQQARHLAQQNGWYIISGRRGDCGGFNVGADEYMLITIKKPYPSFNEGIKRRGILSASTWEELKQRYGNRCASCGSKEGEVHYLYPPSITKLQQGHMNPGQELTLENTIPQCSLCNQPGRNYFVFDENGRVDKIYDPKFILRSEKWVKMEMLRLLLRELE